MKDYWIIDVEEEYPGYTGTEKWILITELSEEEFHTRHPEKPDLWKSSVVISKEMAKVMFCYDFNDRKHLQRSMETEDSMDEMELDVEDPGAQDTFLSLWVEEALNTLTEDQRRRVSMHYLQGYSFTDIAKAEGVKRNNVRKSVERGLRRLREYCGVTPSKSEVMRNG